MGLAKGASVMNWKVLVVLLPLSLLPLVSGVLMIRNAERLMRFNRKLVSFGFTGNVWPSRDSAERPISFLEKMLAILGGIVLIGMGMLILVVALSAANH
jgi:putative Mn2+ efflux pump MntP